MMQSSNMDYRCYSRGFLLLAIISVCVGIVVFVNGMINCFDQGNVARILNNQGCYYCGIAATTRVCPSFCQYTGSFTFYAEENTPITLYGFNYMCGGVNIWNLANDQQDSGFFFRVHEIVRTPQYDYPRFSSFEKMYYVDAFPLLMTLAIVCGFGWMISGAIGIFAFMQNNRFMVAVSSILCGFIFLFFLVFFCLIWTKVLYITNDCFPLYGYGTEGNYNSFQGHATRSSMNFLVYSIVSFIFEFFAICFGIRFYMLMVPDEVLPEDYSVRKVVIPPGYNSTTSPLPVDNSSIRQIVLEPPKYNYQPTTTVVNPSRFVTPLPYSSGFV